MDIWPAIDLRHGRCVRLQQGDYQRETVFGEDPAAMARHWVNQGADRLHLVDLDAAKGEDSTANREAVAKILAAVNVPCQLGGGVRDQAAIDALLELGLFRLIVGSAALKQPDWFARMCDHYPQRLVAGIDARDGLVATDGWLQTSQTPAVQLARDLRTRTANIAAIVYTDIAKDGMMQGPNLVGLVEMANATDIPIVASGGVTSLEDVRQLKVAGLPAAIMGRSLYERHVSLADVLQVAG